MHPKFLSSKILFLLIGFFIFSCNKKAEIKPAEIAEKLVGKYTMSELIAQGQTIKLPFKQNGNEINGTIEVVKSAATEINLSYTFNTVFEGKKETDTATDVFYIKQGAKDLEIFEDDKFTKQVGSLVDKTLFLVSGETDRITAIKN